mmetsp:Transcript_22528/g.38174  ORF Transcript_22528/g.38174 Transcript_22528/m.38174 type:complete len:202 (+) Transcript_22528:785-1390(+)
MCQLFFIAFTTISQRFFRLFVQCCQRGWRSFRVCIRFDTEFFTFGKRFDGSRVLFVGGFLALLIVGLQFGTKRFDFGECEAKVRRFGFVVGFAGQTCERCRLIGELNTILFFRLFASQFRFQPALFLACSTVQIDKRLVDLLLALFQLLRRLRVRLRRTERVRRQRRLVFRVQNRFSERFERWQRVALLCRKVATPRFQYR